MADSKRTLVVVESPAKAKTIGKYLGRGFTVKATVGHIRDLPERELGVDVDAKFKPKFVTVKGKQKAIKTGVSAGRVQTVALRLIVEREDAIKKFVPVEYWSITAKCEKDGHEFDAELHKVDGHKPEISNEAAAQAIVGAVKDKPFIV